MRLKNLQTFYWVATIGSFRQASERLYTTQPAVSARIAALERDLGVQLFDRSVRQARLTAVGHDVLRYAEKMMELSNDLTGEVAGAERMSGVFRIGASETLVHTWFPDLLAALPGAFPGITVEAHVDITPNLRDDLVRREMDIAFLVGPVSEPSMVNLPCGSYPMVWIAGTDMTLPDGVLGRAEIAAHSILTFPRRTRPAMNVQNALRGADIPPLKINFASSLTAILQLVEQGFALAAVPEAVIGGPVAEGRVRRLEVDFQLDDLAFTATYPNSPDDRVAEAITEMALEMAARNAGP